MNYSLHTVENELLLCKEDNTQGSINQIPLASGFSNQLYDRWPPRDSKYKVMVKLKNSSDREEKRKYYRTHIASEEQKGLYNFPMTISTSLHQSRLQIKDQSK